MYRRELALSERLICYKCARSNFLSVSGLTQHIAVCPGLDHLEERNLSDYFPRFGNADQYIGHMRTEDMILRNARHTDGSAPISFTHTKNPNYFPSKSAKKAHKKNLGDSASESNSSSSGENSDTSNDEDDVTPFNSNGSSAYHPDSDSCSERSYTKITPRQHADPPFVKDASVPPSAMFSIELADILGKHRTDLSLHDEIVRLLQKHSNDNKLNFYSGTLKKRAGLISKLEDVFETKKLKPKNTTVTLTDGTKTTVPIFDVEAMIMSLLQDDELMKNENLAPGYDLHTGRATEEVTHYGEIHTGDAWEPARKFHCGEHPNNQNMPISLIIFGDKSHFDLHGALATTPLIFTLSCFNKEARNRVEFWRPIAYIPNLKHSKVSYKSGDKVQTSENVQDEHNCLSAALEQIITIRKKGGIAMTVRGKTVVGKVWIHYVIGDTAGNNVWMGHYNSSNSSRGYRDCKCVRMKDSNPICEYVTVNEYKDSIHQMNNTSTKKAWMDISKSVSKHRIENAFTKDGLPVSDQEHGMFKMFPPELLHTTYEGITEYMLKVLSDYLKDADKPRGAKDPREVVDSLHRTFYSKTSRNSERDVPRGASRSSLLRDTRLGATERRGNLFILLCISHTAVAEEHLWPYLYDLGIEHEEFIDSLKLYLSMEEWFHAANPIIEVKNARPLISQCIENIQQVFRRAGGNGWEISKMHGLTKMQHYMCLFGSAINFFGGPGECHHKKFVKDMGYNTQGRVNNFSSQVAQKYYESALFAIAKAGARRREQKKFKCIGRPNDSNAGFSVEGKYHLRIHGLSKGVSTRHSCHWAQAGNRRSGCDVHNHFIDTLSRDAYSRGCRDGFNVVGYTCMKTRNALITQNSVKTKNAVFRCASKYQGNDPWFDWCLVKFDKDDGGDRHGLYPARILGIFQYETSGIADFGYKVCVRTSDKALDMKKFKSDFVARFTVDHTYQEHADVIDSALTIVSAHDVFGPLFVFENNGGPISEYFCALPRRDWVGYFSSRIKVPTTKRKRKRKPC